MHPCRGGGGSRAERGDAQSRNAWLAQVPTLNSAQNAMITPTPSQIHLRPPRIDLTPDRPQKQSTATALLCHHSSSLTASGTN